PDARHRLTAFVRLGHVEEFHLARPDIAARDLDADAAEPETIAARCQNLSPDPNGAHVAELTDELHVADAVELELRHRAPVDVAELGRERLEQACPIATLPQIDDAPRALRCGVRERRRADIHGRRGVRAA